MAFKEFSTRWRDQVDERIANDSDRARQLLDQVRRLNSQIEGSELDHVVSQPWGRTRWDWYDAAALVEVAEAMQLGFWIMAHVDLDQMPGRDRDETGNQSKLHKLPEPFTATCLSGNADDDGRLEWTQPIEIRHEMHEAEALVVRYPPAGIPLEIGHTEPDTTIGHLRLAGGVARWPYGEERITLLLSTGAFGRETQLRVPEILVGADTLRARAVDAAGHEDAARLSAGAPPDFRGS